MKGISVSVKPLYYYKRRMQQAPVLNLPVMEANLIVRYNSEFNEYGVSYLTTINMKYVKINHRAFTLIEDAMSRGCFKLAKTPAIGHLAIFNRVESPQHVKALSLFHRIPYQCKFSANQ